jgi:hypothetical protein
MARPSSLTPALVDAVAGVVRVGARRKDAALALGVSERAYYKWLERGNREISRLAATGEDEPNPTEELYVQFVQASTKAWAEAKVTAITTIRQAMQGTHPNRAQWQAAAWWLERTYPLEYGRQRIVVEDARLVDREERVDEATIADTLADSMREWLAKQPAPKGN